MTPQRMDMILRLRQRGIHDLAVLRAMEKLPRDRFSAVSNLETAYGDAVLPLPCGQTLPPPFILAVMAQSLGLRSDHRVLLIGAGSGYLAGIVAQCCARLFAVERYNRLTRLAQNNLASVGLTNVLVMHGDGVLGWPDKASFDAIICAGRVDAVPAAWTRQITPSGRIVTGFGRQIILQDGAGHAEGVVDYSLPSLMPGMSKAL